MGKASFQKQEGKEKNRNDVIVGGWFGLKKKKVQPTVSIVKKSGGKASGGEQKEMRVKRARQPKFCMKLQQNTGEKKKDPAGNLGRRKITEEKLEMKKNGGGGECRKKKGDHKNPTKTVGMAPAKNTKKKRNKVCFKQ